MQTEAQRIRTGSLPRSEAGLSKLVMVTLKAALEERSLDTTGDRPRNAELVRRLPWLDALAAGWCRRRRRRRRRRPLVGSIGPWVFAQVGMVCKQWLELTRTSFPLTRCFGACVSVQGRRDAGGILQALRLRASRDGGHQLPRNQNRPLSVPCVPYVPIDSATAMPPAPVYCTVYLYTYTVRLIGLYYGLTGARTHTHTHAPWVR